MKQAMMLTAIDPGIGGVLVFGDRGTGKSTAVRALAALLPPITAGRGLPGELAAAERGVPRLGRDQAPKKIVSRPTPVIDLPLGATEDRVVGALDIERALTRAKRRSSRGCWRGPIAGISISTR
jgi:magnesium chelatase subunit I